MLMYIPPAQFEQVPALLIALILPAKQKEHAETPTCENVPAVHSWHGSGNVGMPVPVPYVPAAHIVHASDCACEYFPAGQLLHVANGYEEYFPAIQTRHDDWLVAAAASE